MRLFFWGNMALGTLQDRDLNSYIESPYRTYGTMKEVISFSFIHSRIHLGTAFSISSIFTGIAAAASVNLHLFPQTSAMHTSFSLSSSANFRLDIIESPTITGNGTALNVINMNRYSSNVSTALAYHTATYTDGTTLRSIFIGGGAGGNASGGSGGVPVREDSEFILKAGLHYIILATNLDGANAIAGLETGHYEL